MLAFWRILAVLAAVLAVRAADLRDRVSGGSKLNEEIADLEDSVRHISEMFRSLMTTGSQQFNLPVMDPVNVPSDLSFKVGGYGLEAQVDAKKMQVSGASQFQLTKIVQEAGTNKVTMEFLVPTLTISCNYGFSGAFGFAFIKSNVKEIALLTSKMLNVRGVATAELVTVEDGTLALASFDISSWTYDSFDYEVEDIKDSGVVARSANKILNKFVYALVIKPHMDDISAWVSASGRVAIGRYMDGIAGHTHIAELDKKAAELLEQFRGVMRTGSEELSVPLLDPIEFDEITVPHINSKGIKVDMTLTEVVVKQMSNFVIEKISQREGSDELDVELQVPAISASGRYTANGKALFLSLVDDGNVYIDIKGLKIKATASLGLTIDGAYELKTLKIDSWSIESIEESFQNLETNFIIGFYYSFVLNRAIPSVIQASHDEISAWAESSALNILSKFLAAVASQPAAPALHTVHVALPEEVMTFFGQLLAQAA